MPYSQRLGVQDLNILTLALPFGLVYGVVKENMLSHTALRESLVPFGGEVAPSAAQYLEEVRAATPLQDVGRLSNSIAQARAETVGVVEGRLPNLLSVAASDVVREQLVRPEVIRSDTVADDSAYYNFLYAVRKLVEVTVDVSSLTPFNQGLNPVVIDGVLLQLAHDAVSYRRLSLAALGFHRPPIRNIARVSPAAFVEDAIAHPNFALTWRQAGYKSSGWIDLSKPVGIQ